MGLKITAAIEEKVNPAALLALEAALRNAAELLKDGRTSSTRPPISPHLMKRPTNPKNGRGKEMPWRPGHAETPPARKGIYGLNREF